MSIEIQDLRIAHANESLMAVSKGLEINSEDIVLSIGGSGDYAFMFLKDGAKRVYVKDVHVPQIEYIKKRVEALRKGNLEDFAAVNVKDNGFYHKFSESPKIQRDNYFNQEENYQKILNNLDRLVILESGDILKNDEGILFSKIYLSNATSAMNGVKLEHMRQQFLKINKKLLSKGLFYISAGRHHFQKEWWQNDYVSGIFLTDKGIDAINQELPKSLIVEEVLTKKARNLENVPWSPIVFKKIN